MGLEHEGSGIIDRAVIYAVKAHEGATRKGKAPKDAKPEGAKLPYIVHPLEAMAVVASMTGDQEVIAAAALHDVLEDTSATVDDLRREFGDRVASIVAGESEDKRSEKPASSTWRIRKEEGLDRLREGTREEKMVALGDKLSNMRAIYRDHLDMGKDFWQIFNEHDPMQHYWYYSTIAEICSELDAYAAWQEYDELLHKVFAEYL